MSEETCPGPNGPNAGRASACAGCPNAARCAAGQGAAEDPDIATISEHLSTVKHILIVLSGKGGVGKSTVSTQLCFWLADRLGKKVGLLDLDICGPSAPTMTNTVGEPVHNSAFGWEPVSVSDNFKLISVGHLLTNTDAALIWRGPRKNGLIKQFLMSVAWGELDYLVIDTPPGTGDEHLSMAQFLGKANVDGAILVTTPQEVSLSDVRKEVDFCRKAGIKIVGLVENMSGFVCPCCNKDVSVFVARQGHGPRDMCNDMGIAYLGRVPIDPAVSAAGDQGVSWAQLAEDLALEREDGQVPMGLQAFDAVVNTIISEVKRDEAPKE